MAIIEFPSSQYFYYNSSFKLESGETLPKFTLAYETFGKLNSDKTNAILIFHALSGSAHVTRNEEEFKLDKGIKGWWENLVGPNKSFDTKKYFIICTNVIGSCYGSTGPSSINPKTSKFYALDFPIITIHDMVKAQKLLIEYLEIDQLLTVTGGSMGGMLALDWFLNYPETVKSIIPIATTLQSSPQNIAFNEVGRQAIIRDPNWNNGNYYSSEPPQFGLSIARMIGHITYLSDGLMRIKFGRKIQEVSNEANDNNFKFGQKFCVESYLNYKGLSFTKRFDANSYLYITKAIDYFDIYSDKKILDNLTNKQSIFKDKKSLILCFKSDWLYPISESKQIAKFFKKYNIRTTFCKIDSNYGHDAFLIEDYTQGKLIKCFLKNIET